jgi:energy-coupling factor transport system substrate-specific component
MIEQRANKTLTGKDLITIGIFTAIYFIINFIFMLSSGLSPVIWVLMPGLIALFSGVPFMIMTSKVQKLGAVFIMGIIVGLFYFITGQFTIVILISFAIACTIAEIIRYVTRYKGFVGNMLSYVAFSLGMTGSPLPIWLFKEKFLSQISEQGLPTDYVTILESIITFRMLIVLFVAPIIGAVVGALIAKKFFQKHLHRAGIV